MDGYAVRAADLVAASTEHPVSLTLAFEISAGDSPIRAVAAGEAARILTGAALPPDADAVVRQ
jgi:molybdopterin molybdotransferase